MGAHLILACLLAAVHASAFTAMDFDEDFAAASSAKPGIGNEMAWWRFDETGATTLFADVYQKHDMTGNFYASDRTVEWVGGKAIAFDGLADFAFTPAHTDFAPGLGDFTVTFWIKIICFNSTPTWIGFIDSRQWAIGPDDGWSVGYGTREDFPDFQRVSTHFADGYEGWDFVSDGSNCSASQLELDTWQHWAVVFARTSGELRFYLNGTLDATRTPAFPSGPIGSVVTLRVGADNRDGFTGMQIAHLRVFKKSLNAEEISQVFTDR